MSLILTCPLGLESLAKKEIEILGLNIIEVQDKQIRIEYGEKSLINLNLWSRIGNKVYIELARKEQTDTFDKLFDLVQEIDWKKYIQEGQYIAVNVTTKDSQLTSTPAMQGIVKKSIIKHLVGNNIWRENPESTFHIDVFFMKNTCQILLDTSGETLSKRGYRLEAGEAPLRENIAAGIVLLSGWRFREALLDPFCGSGTILIEAALIARNIAPGLKRNFAFENFDWINQTLVNELKETAKVKVFQNDFKLYGSDIDEEVLSKAKKNIVRAGVEDIITLDLKDFKEYTDFVGTIITNPPYGLRLQSDDITTLYKEINELFRNKNISGGLITTFDMERVSKEKWKKRKLYNGGEKCDFYKKEYRI